MFNKLNIAIDNHLTALLITMSLNDNVEFMQTTKFLKFSNLTLA